MNKGAIVNLIAISLIIASFFVNESISKYLYYSGLFAFSGAITNQIAIYMIFNRVPFFYGSGVIELNFEKFKKSIKDMIMEQFFTPDRLQKILSNEINNDITILADKIDYELLYQNLKESIMQSKIGQVINMFGGESIIDSQKVTLIEKIKSSIKSILLSETFQNQINKLSKEHISRDIIKKIDIIIEDKLNELTPKDVKNLVEKLIKEHLDWLIVWGGVFGGIIGLISVFIR